jgi:GNAT superfamily N-acetyltransferase
LAEIVVREATPADIPLVAGFRYDEDSPDPSGRDAFVADFVAWVAAHPSFHCIVAFDGAEVVGMSWLVEQPRVPGVDNFERAGGDIQTVFVSPEYRNSGIGARMLAVIEELTGSLGLVRVTVQASSRAIPFYERAGYVVPPRVRMRTPPSR